MERRLVSFPVRDSYLRGYLYRPDGAGRFPAILWSHGSERFPAPPDTLARFFTSAGYVVFCPHRRGHGSSPGEYALRYLGSRARAESSDGETTRGRAVELLIALQERCLEDTIEALRWLRRLALVDSVRVAMAGVSHGAIQTMLAAAAGCGAKAHVAFAPAAIGWDGNPELQQRLVRAARSARAPTFLIQAGNDYSLGPSERLGAELRRGGSSSRTRVYPPYGVALDHGHAAFASEGMAVWGSDVRDFLDTTMNPRAQIV